MGCLRKLGSVKASHPAVLLMSVALLPEVFDTE